MTRSRSAPASTPAATNPWATGGGGFNYEDQVAAWLLLHMLRARPPLEDALGVPVRLRWQAWAGGYALDDLVLTLRTSSGVVGTAEISVKSGQQVRANRFPEDFVTACWRRLNPNATPRFDLDRDRVVLIEPSLSAEARTGWSDLEGWSRAQRPETLHDGMERETLGDDASRTMYQSLKGPVSPSTVAAGEIPPTPAGQNQSIARSCSRPAPTHRSLRSWIPHTPLLKERVAFMAS